MQQSRLKGLWSEDRPVLNGWVSIDSPFVAEILAGQGYDSLTVDLQHGLADLGSLAPILQAIRASGVTPLVRVPGLDTPSISRALDAGALGVICPMIETADEARALADAVRYPPGGRRSFGPTRAAVVHGAGYAAAANDAVVCLAMIETGRALDAVEAIAAVEGIDALYIGPSDLTLSLAQGSLSPGFDREEAQMIEAIHRIGAAAHRAGKRVGLHNGSPEYAARALASGFDLVTLPNDVRLLADAAAASVARTRRLAAAPGTRIGADPLPSRDVPLSRAGRAAPVG